MANAIYDQARYKLMTGAFNWTTVSLMVSAWSGTPIFFPADKTLDNVTAHGKVRRGSSAVITSQTVATDGTGQTNQVVIPSLLVGQPITFLTMSDKKPTIGLSETILFIDEAEGLPFTANGLDMVIFPDWLQNRGWFKP